MKKKILILLGLFFFLLLLAIIGVSTFYLDGMMAISPHIKKYPLDVHISKIRPLAWKCTVDGRTIIYVTAHVFPISENTQVALKNRQKMIKIAFARLREEDIIQGNNSNTPSNIRQFCKEQLLAQKRGYFTGTGSWARWPIVFDIPLLSPGGATQKTIFICRSSRASADFVFTISDSVGFRIYEYAEIVRKITALIDEMGKEQLSSLRKEKDPFFDSEGAWADKAIRMFAGETVFPKQH